MTNTGPLLSITSSGVAQRPLVSLLHKPIPFNMASIITSAALASSHSLYSLPNWTRLTTGDDDDNNADAAEDTTVDALMEEEGVASLHENGAANDIASATSLETTGSSGGAANNETSLAEDRSTSTAAGLLAPTYSTPHEASAAYQSGLLKSDFTISSNHPSIRLAFRYVLEDPNNDVNNNAQEEEEGKDLFLCWVRQDGIPCHFRTLHPIRNNVTAAAEVAVDNADDNNGVMGEDEHGNLRGTSNNNEPKKQPSSLTTTTTPTVDTLLVNEHDHIETTFPGHAFVFCRRVDYELGGEAGITADDDNESRNQDDLIVVNDNNGNTYFLRKRKCNEKEETNNESQVEWEAFLMVGGFRPGPMPEDGNSEADNDGEAGMVDDDGSNNEEGKTEESDDESSDDDSIDGREHQVQLVTIQPIPKHPSATAIKNDPSNSETETDDDDLPSKALGCSNCAQSVPFLRGAMNPRPRHAPAFVATKSNEDIDAPNPPLPNNDHPTDEEYALMVTVCTTQLDPTPLDTSSKHYDAVILGGWPCRTEPGCFPADREVPSNTPNPLRSRFIADLLAASSCLPPAARQKLLLTTPIWINESQSFGPAASPVEARDGCFHPGSQWLVRNGMNPAKCGGVEWYSAQHYMEDCDLWGAGGLMLHELSHAWHCLHVEDGYENEEIINVYERAMEEGLYDCVGVHGSQGPRCRAYACQDQMEFFAELSVAFLGGLDDDREHNKWYPFNRSQLRDHDPRAFAMLCRMWGVEDDN
mmetsp:Transcript_25380/g.41650  ORF Transcript_25380/g.41650 Transcript_25380/m.41650 type:complete len:756 (-) Transcript_25380:329-2596(-)|eukprot:CAMPEP_0201870372 /NCGR_PEP_ID=MMETSP0902-20130614/3485_1 /ASSEMBLY_ACC=CAM_ASM_000551 /TAXON_ID=420261 /ORGANISM="Thalassiosira antarctica, Strain CCMP982" /LENGTH=755 /DNA_ID=CAMNT_0048395963 /DNA_START=33 /DNA_END=2300 /DNA_ORIENTATION=-